MMIVLKLIVMDKIVALATSKVASELFYLMKVTQEEMEADEDEINQWGTKIIEGQLYFRVMYLEILSGSDTRYKIVQKEAIFFKESVVYPIVHLETKPKYLELSASERLEIVAFAENHSV